MTARDNQRSKVYKAERIIEEPGGTMTIGECQALVDKVLASSYVARKFPDRIGRLRQYGITVVAGKGGGRAWSSPANPYRNDYSRAIDWERDRIADGLPRSTYVITLGTWARQPVVVLHEIAHHLAGCHHSHDHVFANTMLTLVSYFVGADAGATLKASFKEHRVRIRPKATRTLTPEQKAAAIANLQAARTGPVAPKVETFDATLVDYFDCVQCHHLLELTRFPTTRTKGIREARCRACRDAR